ncbi:hypothetical protein [Sulfitobacter sp. MOLA879]|uniref:hypothetical protein n=1 Tax=Sulfitobacter sp. MOLA879 TaxID=3368579 RepID=UPI00374560E1
MIIRSALQCETCEAIFTVRIGMGQGIRQEHTVNCRECQEPMSFGMTVNYSELSTNVFTIDGCSIVEVPAHGTGPVVNVDANFVVPEGMTDQDVTFHRLTQMREMMKAAEGFGPLPNQKFDPYAPRRPTADHLSEWKNLKKAVSLASNGRTKLANKKVAEGTAEYYAADPLSGPTDWFFRFTHKFMGRKHGVHFKSMMDEFRSIAATHDCSDLLNHYAESMVKDRFTLYREVYTDFFSKHAQFAQVSFQAGLGIAPSDDMVATSVQFDQVKSFYGDAYEVFAGSVDFLTMLNNVKHGRAFNEFETLTMDKYQKLDNSSKFNPFGTNAVFTALCSEKDNQLRNASHHKGIRIDADGKTLRYRAGKGGTGPEQEFTYASYLYRSVTLFLQISVLVAVELTICSANKIELPFD